MVSFCLTIHTKKEEILPDWSFPQMKEIKDFILQYVAALNERDYGMLDRCFTRDVILHRGMKNYTTKDEVANWYRKQLNSGHLRFELKDASAGILPDASAMCILWFEIKRNNSGKVQKDIHIESLDLALSDGYWKIRKCFGLGFNPEYHKKHFQQDTNRCDE
jgi:hypothetical protein